MIAAVIVSHHARREQAMALASEVGVHGQAVVEDDGSLGDWPNHRRALGRALGALQHGYTHALIIEDDAVPVPNLIAEVEKAVQAHPDGPISLYTGTSRPREQNVLQAVAQARETGASWLEADDMLWGVAYVLPIADIPELVAYADTLHDVPSDERVGAFYREYAGVNVRYTWPSLVDHADGPPVITSGRAPRTKPRVAHEVGTRGSYEGEPVLIARGW